MKIKIELLAMALLSRLGEQIRIQTLGIFELFGVKTWRQGQQYVYGAEDRWKWVC